MQAAQWLLVVAGAGVAVGLTAAGCGSSSSGSTDAGSDAGVDADAACTPEPVTVPDSGACGMCITQMCSAQLAACASDCTCGGTVNTVANCLANLPPGAADASGGIAGLLGSAGALLSCAGGLAPAGGAGGLPGG